MALGTILAEQFDMPILGGMAGRTIQYRLLRIEARMTFQAATLRLVLIDPNDKVFTHLFVDTVGRLVALKLYEANLRER